MTYGRYGDRCTVAAGTSASPGSAGVKNAKAVAPGVDEPLNVSAAPAQLEAALSESGLHAPAGLVDQIAD